MTISIDMSIKSFLAVLVFLCVFFLFGLLLVKAIDWELDNAGRRAEANHRFYEVCVDGDHPFGNGEW